MKKITRKEAFDQVLHWFDAAEILASEDYALANKYVKKARRIAMKHRLRMPSVLKRRFCKNCGSYFIPGKTYRVRMKNKKIVYTCLVCKHMMRIGILSKKKHIDNCAI